MVIQNLGLVASKPARFDGPLNDYPRYALIGSRGMAMSGRHIGTACVPAHTRLPSVPRAEVQRHQDWAVGVGESMAQNRGLTPKSGVFDSPTQGASKSGVRGASRSGWYEWTSGASGTPGRFRGEPPAGIIRGGIGGWSPESGAGVEIASRRLAARIRGSIRRKSLPEWGIGRRVRPCPELIPLKFQALSSEKHSKPWYSRLFFLSDCPPPVTPFHVLSHINPP